MLDKAQKKKGEVLLVWNMIFEILITIIMWFEVRAYVPRNSYINLEYLDSSYMKV